MAEQVYEPGPVGTPYVYTVAGQGDVTPLDCYAEFDGTSALTGYVPTLRFKSPSGHVIAESAIDTTVAAGASAAASWFRGVKASAIAAATASGCAWARFTRVTSFTLPTVAPSKPIPWTGIHISDPAVFEMATINVANDAVKVKQLGIVFAVGSAGWHTPGTYPHSIDVGSDFFGFGAPQETPVTTSSSPVVSSGQPYNVGDVQVLGTPSVPGNVYLLATNWDGVNRAIDFALFGLVFFPNATAVT